MLLIERCGEEHIPLFSFCNSHFSLFESLSPCLTASHLILIISFSCAFTMGQSPAPANHYTIIPIEDEGEEVKGKRTGVQL